MTATLILDTLANEFSVRTEAVQSVFEMIDAGLSTPFIGRFRRALSDGLSESQIRRLQGRRLELEELDRRRGTILRALERDESVPPQALEAIRVCMDRFELEDLFVPHRRPEPEVQLALDRGLGALADELVRPVPRAARGPAEAATPGTDQAEAAGDEEPLERADEPDAPSASADETPPVGDASGDASGDAASDAPSADPSELAHEVSIVAGLPLRITITPKLARICQPYVNPDKGIHTESEALAGAVRILSDRLGRSSHLRGLVRNFLRKRGTLEVRPLVDDAKAGRHRSLLKLRQPLRQIQGHRLLALRQAQKERVLNASLNLDPSVALPKVRAALGRHADPDLESLLSEIARQALVARLLPVVEADVRLELKERGDAEALRFLSQHLRQVLLTPPLGAIPVAGVDVNARGDWTVALLGSGGEVLETARIELQVAVPAPETVAEATAEDSAGEPAPAGEAAETPTATDVEAPADASRALDADPADPADPADSAAAPATLEPEPAVGSEAAAVPAEPGPAAPRQEPAPRRAPRPALARRKKTEAELGAELGALLSAHGTRAIAIGHGKSARSTALAIRRILEAAGVETPLTVVNEVGLSSYASSEAARKELAGLGVPERMAVSLGRRLQDPMAEILKVDPRHLGLGAEQGLVSKANARRALAETIESCVAHVGCDANRAPLSILAHVPGLDRAAAKRLIEARAQAPFANREVLRGEGLLTEAQWTSAVAFLRIPDSDQPLDATSLHPETYDLAQRLLESAGGSVKENLGQVGVTKGLRRSSFDVDEATWRDLMRELSQPGRDPRPRLLRPELLHPDTDVSRLVPGRVVYGIVTNVASFGAFVDVGLSSEAMIHISEISSRYVRDARELLSIGQVVRARLLEPSGNRTALSLKDVPQERRARGRDDADTEPARGPRGRGRGRGRDDEERARPTVRAAQTRRDGLAGGRPDRRGGRGGQGGAAGPGRGGPGRGGRRDREGADERVNLERINAEATQSAYSPFARFFRENEAEAPRSEAEGS